MRLQRLRDAFLPPLLTGGDLERRRARRAVALLLLLLTGSLFSVGTQLVLGQFASSGRALVGALLPLSALFAIRRGLSSEWVLVAVLVLGLGGTAAAAVAGGQAGLPALGWLIVAAPFTLAVARPAVAFAILAYDTALMVAAIAVVNRPGFQPVLAPTAAVQAITVVGALVTLFAVIRAYEGEVNRTLGELERRNAELVSARRASDAASQAKSDFLATMSHEIRTPLNGVLGITSIMLSEPDLPPRVRGDLETISSSGAALLAVVSDVLDFSKIEAGQLELEETPVQLRLTLDGVCSLFEGMASERGNTLSVDVDAEVPDWLLGDPVRLRQVLMNLTSNALKFTSAGAVALSARLAGDELVLQVRDTGIGMSPEAVARLFQPFVQADASTTRQYGGTGLGLAIASRLVHAMGGTIAAASLPGEGSTFTVTLPARPVPPPSHAARGSDTPSRPMKVLVAEDNLINQRVAARLLAQLGHEVELVANGAEAVARARSVRFDVVLMDCYMPVMDGFDAAAALVRTGDAPPIIALTASSLASDRQRCVAAGMIGVLPKPIHREMLARALAALPRRVAPAG